MHTEPGPVEGPCKHREITQHGEWKCIRNALFTPDGGFIGHRGEPADNVRTFTPDPLHGLAAREPEFRPAHYMVNMRNPNAPRIIGTAR